MRQKRILIDGAFYHVTSRANNKIHAFEDVWGQKMMLVILQKAKEKFGFKLTNFCVMPNHIHLLISPMEGTNLSKIIQWIKTRSAKSWNLSHNSRDHLWGERFFSGVIQNAKQYDTVMNYIDQNPVAAGLVSTPTDWKASGAYYNTLNITDMSLLV